MQMNKSISKITQALALVDQGMTPREAGRQIDVSESVIYRARNERDAKAAGCCVKCGAPVDANGDYTIIADTSRALP